MSDEMGAMYGCPKRFVDATAAGFDVCRAHPTRLVLGRIFSGISVTQVQPGELIKNGDCAQSLPRDE